MTPLDARPDIAAGSVIGGDSAAVFDAPITLYSNDEKDCRTLDGVVDTRTRYSIVPAHHTARVGHYAPEQAYLRIALRHLGLPALRPASGDSEREIKPPGSSIRPGQQASHHRSKHAYRVSPGR